MDTSRPSSPADASGTLAPAVHSELLRFPPVSDDSALPQVPLHPLFSASDTLDPGLLGSPSDYSASPEVPADHVHQTTDASPRSPSTVDEPSISHPPTTDSASLSPPTATIQPLAPENTAESPSPFSPVTDEQPPLAVETDSSAPIGLTTLSVHAQNTSSTDPPSSAATNTSLRAPPPVGHPSPPSSAAGGLPQPSLSGCGDEWRQGYIAGFGKGFAKSGNGSADHDTQKPNPFSGDIDRLSIVSGVSSTQLGMRGGRRLRWIFTLIRRALWPMSITVLLWSITTAVVHFAVPEPQTDWRSLPTIPSMLGHSPHHCPHLIRPHQPQMLPWYGRRDRSATESGALTPEFIETHNFRIKCAASISPACYRHLDTTLNNVTFASVASSFPPSLGRIGKDFQPPQWTQRPMLRYRIIQVWLQLWFRVWYGGGAKETVALEHGPELRGCLRLLLVAMDDAVAESMTTPGIGAGTA